MDRLTRDEARRLAANIATFALREQHRDRIVAEHAAENPGTRPTRWWEFDAPEQWK